METLTESTPKLVDLSLLTDYGAQDAEIQACGAVLSVRLRPDPLPGPHVAEMRQMEKAHVALKRLINPVPEEPPSEEEAARQTYIDFFEEREARDVRRKAVEMIVAWLVSWNACDREGNPIPLNAETLYDDPTRTDVYVEILRAIDAKAVELAVARREAHRGVPVPEPAPASKPTPRRSRRKAAGAL